MVEHRKLRPRVQRSYTQISGEDILDGYSICDKLKEPRYALREESCQGLVDHLPDGMGVTVERLQTQGFTHPLVIHNPTGLGLRVPSSTFSVDDVCRLIGPQRKLDVMDCRTQQAVTMSLDQFCSYYKSRGCGRGLSKPSSGQGVLNVISLEFSHTQLDPLVEPPALVRELDWVGTVWPNDLINRQRDPTNDMRRMMYPKVRKYCLMSVAGCYTDFHVDFGGTSVWYHILKGEKIFFLIPPSSKSYDQFLKWHNDDLQELIFFADEIEKCEVVRLTEGDTLLMPSGWIHAVYTPTDSLVFGGNFLNCFNISQQLQVAMLENKLKVKSKFRFPFYSHIHWYLLHECHRLFNALGIPYGKDGPEEQVKTENDTSHSSERTWLKAVSVKKLTLKDCQNLGYSYYKEERRRAFEDNEHVNIIFDFGKEKCCVPHLSEIEREGLLLLVRQMKSGSMFGCDIPTCIYHPQLLLERLEYQLTSSVLTSICCGESNGVSILSHLVTFKVSLEQPYSSPPSPPLSHMDANNSLPQKNNGQDQDICFKQILETQDDPPSSPPSPQPLSPARFTSPSPHTSPHLTATPPTHTSPHLSATPPHHTSPHGPASSHSPNSPFHTLASPSVFPSDSVNPLSCCPKVSSPSKLLSPSARLLHTFFQPPVPARPLTAPYLPLPPPPSLPAPQPLPAVEPSSQSCYSPSSSLARPAISNLIQPPSSISGQPVSSLPPTPSPAQPAISPLPLSLDQPLNSSLPPPPPSSLDQPLIAPLSLPPSSLDQLLNAPPLSPSPAPLPSLNQPLDAPPLSPPSPPSSLDQLLNAPVSPPQSSLDRPLNAPPLPPSSLNQPVDAPPLSPPSPPLSSLDQLLNAPVSPPQSSLDRPLNAPLLPPSSLNQPLDAPPLSLPPSSLAQSLNAPPPPSPLPSSLDQPLNAPPPSPSPPPPSSLDQPLIAPQLDASLSNSHPPVPSKTQPLISSLPPQPLSQSIHSSPAHPSVTSKPLSCTPSSLLRSLTSPVPQTSSSATPLISVPSHPTSISPMSFFFLPPPLNLASLPTTTNTTNTTTLTGDFTVTSSDQPSSFLLTSSAITELLNTIMTSARPLSSSTVLTSSSSSPPLSSPPPPPSHNPLPPSPACTSNTPVRVSQQTHAHIKSKLFQATRRKRCGACEGCIRKPCDNCKFCLDSPRHGGSGKLKQACLYRKCTALVKSLSSSSSSSSSTTTTTITTTTTTSSSSSVSQITCERRPADSTTGPDVFSPTSPVLQSIVPAPTTVGINDVDNSHQNTHTPLQILLVDRLGVDGEEDKDKIEDYLASVGEAEEDRGKIEDYVASVGEAVKTVLEDKPFLSSITTLLDREEHGVDMSPPAKRQRHGDEVVISNQLSADPLLSSITSPSPHSSLHHLLSSPTVSASSFHTPSLSSLYPSSFVGSGDFTLQMSEEELREQIAALPPLPSRSVSPPLPNSFLLEEMAPSAEQSIKS